MKEHQRAWVMGEKSYGKGVVQKLFPLPSGAALQMTVSHYYTPNGNMIEGQGIQPNQTYPLPPEMKEEVYLDRVADLLLKESKFYTSCSVSVSNPNFSDDSVKSGKSFLIF